MAKQNVANGPVIDRDIESLGGRQHSLVEFHAGSIVEQGQNVLRTTSVASVKVTSTASDFQENVALHFTYALLLWRKSLRPPLGGDRRRIWSIIEVVVEPDAVDCHG